MGAAQALSERPFLPTTLMLTEEQGRRLRRYSLLVTITMMILCNAIFLFGLWATGANLDKLIKIPERFNPLNDICLRFIWRPVAGEEQPVRLCSEWIMLSDPTGETHTIQKETEVVKGGDGRLYFDYGTLVDYRLFVFAAFVGMIIALGIWGKRTLIRRYRTSLERENFLQASSSVQS
jgi:hypothetical protein